MSPALELPPAIAANQVQFPAPVGSAQPLRPVAPTTPAKGPLTKGLAAILGSGLKLAPLNAQPAQPTTDPMFNPPVPPPVPEAMQAPQGQPITQGSPFSISTMLNEVVQSSPPGTEASSLEAVRMEMFGRYYEEIEARMKELRAVLEGGVARARKAMLDRVDELGAALHRDMVTMRQETHKELEDLKRDVFTTVMSVSAINDKIGLGDSRNRETWVAMTKALADRVDHQARANQQAIEEFRTSINDGLEQRVTKVVEGTLMKLAAVRRADMARQGQPPAEPPVVVYGEAPHAIAPAA